MRRAVHADNKVSGDDQLSHVVVSHITPRQNDLQWTTLVTAIFGLSMSAHDPNVRRKLLLFACLTFLNFATNVAALLNKMEMPPGARHLLSATCPISGAEIGRFVSREQHQFNTRLMARFARVEHMPEASIHGWRFPPEAMFDLCSMQWALGNSYLIISSILVLRMHIFALQMLRSIQDIYADVYPENWTGMSGHVVVLDPNTPPSGTFGSALQHRPGTATFVPFSGQARKLEF